jgi:hypothetical protein
LKDDKSNNEEIKPVALRDDEDGEDEEFDNSNDEDEDDDESLDGLNIDKGKLGPVY